MRESINRYQSEILRPRVMCILAALQSLRFYADPIVGRRKKITPTEKIKERRTKRYTQRWRNKHVKTKLGFVKWKKNSVRYCHGNWMREDGRYFFSLTLTLCSAHSNIFFLFNVSFCVVCVLTKMFGQKHEINLMNLWSACYWCTFRFACRNVIWVFRNQINSFLFILVISFRTFFLAAPPHTQQHNTIGRICILNDSTRDTKNHRKQDK